MSFSDGFYTGFSETNFRHFLFSEARIQPGESLCVKTGAKRGCAP